MTSTERLLREHGASTACLVLLLIVTGFLDLFAKMKLELSQRQFALMDAKAINEIRFFDFVHAYPFLIVGYFLVFETILVLLEVLKVTTPLRILAFIILSIPALAYGLTCLHLGSKFAAF